MTVSALHSGIANQWRRGCWAGLGCLLWLTGCKQITVETPPNPVLISRLPRAQISFDVQKGEQRHSYTLTGTANFPNQTELNLLAVRQLRPVEENAQSTFSILDYRVVTVEDGRWQGELLLKQPDANGSPKETWQLDQTTLDLSVEPLDTVSILVTYTPTDQLTTLERVLAQQGLKIAPELLQTTSEGRRYLEIRQVLSLPVDAQIGERPQPYNGGWGTRHLLIEEPPMPYQVAFPKERQTNRPAEPEEFLY